MKRYLNSVFLALIIFLSFFLRIYRLDNLELFGDEIDVGYQAYSVLKTARDYRGNFLPFYMESFSESRAPLFLYSAVPFIKIFGLNEWGVRLPAVFWGVLGIVFLYLLVKLLFKDSKTALISSLLLSVSYWHLHYSRAAFEVTLLLFLVLSGTYFFLKGEKRRVFYYFSAFCFALSFYTYNTANVFVPLWGLSLVILSLKETKKLKPLLLPGFVFFLAVLPLGFKVLNGQASDRFSKISIFSDPASINWIIEKRSSGDNSLKERFFYNKLTRFSYKFGENYLTSFSPQFLFISGDPNPRHSVPGFGMFPWAFLPLLLLGIYFSLKKFDQKEHKFLWLWLAFSPLASALTAEGGNQATRLFLMLPAFVVLMALGVKQALSLKFGKVLVLGFAMLLIFNIFSYFHELFSHYSKDQFKYWHYGYKEITLALKESDCRRVYINNNHEPFLPRYLFWMKKDPAWFQKKFEGDQGNQDIGENFSGFKLEESFFGRVKEDDKLLAIKQILEEKDTCLIAFQKDEIPGDWNLKESKHEGINVLKLVKNPLGEPYIYLLKGD